MSLNQPLELLNTILLLKDRGGNNEVCIILAKLPDHTVYTQEEQYFSQIVEMRWEDVPPYHPSSFSSEPREIPLHFRTDPPAYSVCLLYSADEEEDGNSVKQNILIKQIFFF